MVPPAAATPPASSTSPAQSSALPVQHVPVETSATTRRRSVIEFVDQLRPRTRNALIAGAVVVAFVVGIGAGAAGRSSDDAEAAAAATSSAAGTVAANSPTLPPVTVASTESPAAKPTQDVEAAVPSTEPEVTTHGVTESDAMLACARYGGDEFPYGFKDHSILGNIAQNIEKNHWFIKHEVTITNAYNAKIDTVFECTVGGTHAKPSVTEFHVYK